MSTNTTPLTNSATLARQVAAIREFTASDVYTALCIIAFNDHARVVLPLTNVDDYDGLPPLLFSGGLSYISLTRCVAQTIYDNALQLLADGFAVQTPVLVLHGSGQAPSPDGRGPAAPAPSSSPKAPGQIVVLIGGEKPGKVIYATAQSLRFSSFWTRHGASHEALQEGFRFSRAVDVRITPAMKQREPAGDFL